jgi:PAS domain S-box-containing protein
MDQMNHDELVSLRERLRELEETIKAIRGGEVDALVVDGSQGPQIFTLKGAEEPYRMLVERMQEGALSLTDDGTIAYANRAFANFVRTPLEKIVGRPLKDFLVEADQAWLPGLFSLARQTGARRELLFQSGTERCPAILSLSLLSAENTEAFSAIVTDLREQRRSEELAAAERFMRSILEQAADAVIVCDLEGHVMLMSGAAQKLARKSGNRMMFGEAFVFALERDGTAGATHPQSPEDLIARALRGESIHGIEVRPIGQTDGQATNGSVHFLMSAGPLHNARGGLSGCIVTLMDISERKQAELRQKLLVDELNHRVKNTLAAVQSIAVQTRRTTESAGAFHQAFTSRLMALARAHDLVTLQAWQGAALADVIHQTLAPFIAGDEARISIEGPPIKLSPNAAVTMSMGFHELATNAVKYGALSAPAGHVSLRWDIDRSADQPAVEIRWIESGGPPVKTPSRRGFGSRLLQQGLVIELDGAVDLDYAETGLKCTARLKLSDKIAPQ